MKTAEHPKPRLRSVLAGRGFLWSRLIGPSPSRMVASTGDLHCSMGASAAHITVTTAQGQVRRPPSLKWSLVLSSVL